jgi:hypothetical protein
MRGHNRHRKASYVDRLHNPFSLFGNSQRVCFRLLVEVDRIGEGGYLGWLVPIRDHPL